MLGRKTNKKTKGLLGSDDGSVIRRGVLTVVLGSARLEKS